MTELAIIVHYIRAVKRLDTARNMLRNAAERMNNSGPSSTMTNNTCEEAAYESLRLFEEGMSDDLNAPRASSGLFHLVKAAEKVSFFSPLYLYVHCCILFHPTFDFFLFTDFVIR